MHRLAIDLDHAIVRNHYSEHGLTFEMNKAQFATGAGSLNKQGASAFARVCHVIWHQRELIAQVSMSDAQIALEIVVEPRWPNLPVNLQSLKRSEYVVGVLGSVSLSVIIVDSQSQLTTVLAR